MNPPRETAVGTLTVVIPAYQEAARILATLEAVSAYLGRHHPGSEILVVDDGSTDETASRVEGFVPTGEGAPTVRCLRHTRNRGKGAAIRTGVLAAGCPWLLLCDADLSTPIEELPKLFEALSEADIAIGSRSIAGASVEVRQPVYRMLMGKTFNRIMRATTWLPYIDTQCGFKLMATSIARSLFRRSRIDGFAFDVELLWLAQRDGLRVREIPVRWRNDPASSVQPIVHSAQMLRDVLRIRWIHRGD